MSKPVRLVLSGFWLAFAAAVILAALLLSAVRLFLPAMGEHREEVAAWVSELVGQPVQIGGLHAGWHGLGPSIELSDVTVLDAGGRRPVLHCASARIDMDLPASLRHWQFEPGLLTVRGVNITLERHDDGAITVAGWGVPPGAMEDSGRNALRQWLQRRERLAVEDSVLEWRDLGDGGTVLQFTGVNLQLRSNGNRHRLDATADLPPSLGQRLKLAMDVRGDLFTTAFWQGQVYLHGTALRLDAWGRGHLPPGLAALDGAADVELWSDWLNGLEQAEGEVRGRDVHAVRAAAQDSGDGGQWDLEALSGGFHWQRRRPGWILDLDNFTVIRGGAALPPMQWRLEFSRDPRSDGRDVRMAFSALPVDDAAAMLQDAGVLPEIGRGHLAVMAPQGVLRNGYLRYRTTPGQPGHFQVSGDFEDVAWRPVQSLPGVQGLSGHVTASEVQGEVTLDTASAAVDLPKLFRAPLSLDKAGGRIVWRRDDQGLVIDALQLALNNPDLTVQADVHAELPADGGSPYLDLTASFDHGNGAHLSRYLPAGIMPAATVAWLDRAIVNGTLSEGGARLSGRLADFPFDDPQRGQFDVRFKVNGGILDYVEGWPRLEEMAAELHFHGRRLEVQGAGIKTLGSEILQAKATIPDMTARPAQVTVTGAAEGPTGDVLRYVTESPLRKIFGAYLAGVTGGGRSHLQLELAIPLAKKVPVRVKGGLRFDDGSLLFRDAGIDITHVAGTLNFTEQGVSADALRANLLGQPVTVDAATRPGETGNVISFTARGKADVAALARRFAAPLAGYVEGSAPWQGVLRIPPKREGWVELQINSTLEGAAVTLPPPMAKTAEERRDLLVQIPLPLKDGKPLHLRYGDAADAQLTLEGDVTRLRVARGELRFGADTAVLPDQDGLRLAGTLQAFDAGQWSGVFGGEKSGRAPGVALGVTGVDMQFGTLMLGKRQLDKVHLQASRGDGAWDLDLDSDQLQGRIHLPDADDAPVVMDLQRLYLSRFKKGGGGAPPDPRRLPPLDIQAKSFRYGALDLGALQLHADRTPDGLRFDRIHAHSPRRDLQISGDWQADDAGQRSAFTLVYDGEDAGVTLSALGFADMINGGKVHTDMQLTWQGAPTAFSLAKTTGTIHFEIKNGRLLEVEPGAGRILGLLSFQALPRRLLLDFSDLFRKGFAFDTLAGSFAIEDGNAQTDNLHMDGPSAHIETRGRVGLAAEDYDQRVLVVPNVSSGLPVAGVIAGGIGAGAALLLAEKILKPGIDKMTRAEYRVTGPWADPDVERITAGQVSKPKS